MRVICADDERLLLEDLEMFAEEVLPQAEIVSFIKGTDAMEFAKANAADIAFLDINMGIVDGVSIAKELQKRNPKTNIIFCTGYSEYALDALDINCSGYLMKPITLEKIQKAVDNLRYPLEELADRQKVLEIQCFGNFDIKTNGESVKFKYRKSREYIAYLVDRKGSLCARREIGAVLFGDEPHEEYLTKLRRDILDTFENLGMSDALQVQKGQMGINKDRVSCDYYDYLNGAPGAKEKFRGEYMSQFSFAESTLAELTKERN